MLTGPITILQWSFVRNDLPREVTARQIAFAIRDEVADLEAAGIKVVQIDEPAYAKVFHCTRPAQRLLGMGGGGVQIGVIRCARRDPGPYAHVLRRVQRHH